MTTSLGTGVITDPYIKDPDNTEPFAIDWTLRLAGNTIATSAWSVPAGLTNAGENNTSTIATLVLSGGTAGETYAVVNSIVDDSGFKLLDQTIYITISEN